MLNYKMVFSYDGSRYKGWQKLGDDTLTIQGILERTISEILDYVVEIHGSGRTDSGVHARGQVVNMKLPFALKEDFQRILNETLPEDIQLLAIERVGNGFHARFSAVEKTYCYYVDTNEKANVFMRKYCYHFPKKVEKVLMEKAVKYLTGTNDFSCFTDDKSEKDKVRTIHDIQIKETEGVFEFVYTGDGFLQHMIRILTGTLLEIGCGKRKPEEIRNMIASKERANAGFMTPGKGLFLEKVKYDERGK